jgi:transcription elongation factor Elf1
MIQKECPLCFCDEQESTVIALELVQATRGKFTYAICGKCKSVYLTEVPNDMSKYYVGYYSFKIDDDRPSRKRLFRRVMGVAINSSFLPRTFFKEPPIFLHKHILQTYNVSQPNAS